MYHLKLKELKGKILNLDNFFLKKKFIVNKIQKWIYFIYNIFYRNLDYRSIKWNLYSFKILNFLRMFIKFYTYVLKKTMFIGFYIYVLKKVIFIFNYNMCNYIYWYWKDVISEDLIFSFEIEYLNYENYEKGDSICLEKKSSMEETIFIKDLDLDLVIIFYSEDIGLIIFVHFLVIFCGFFIRFKKKVVNYISILFFIFLKILYFIYRFFYILILIYKIFKLWRINKDIKKGSFFKKKLNLFLNFYILKHLRFNNVVTKKINNDNWWDWKLYLFLYRSEFIYRYLYKRVWKFIAFFIFFWGYIKAFFEVVLKLHWQTFTGPQHEIKFYGLLGSYYDEVWGDEDFVFEFYWDDIAEDEFLLDLKKYSRDSKFINFNFKFHDLFEFEGHSFLNEEEAVEDFLLSEYFSFFKDIKITFFWKFFKKMWVNLIYFQSFFRYFKGLNFVYIIFYKLNNFNFNFSSKLIFFKTFKTIEALIYFFTHTFVFGLVYSEFMYGVKCVIVFNNAILYFWYLKCRLFI